MKNAFDILRGLKRSSSSLDARSASDEDRTTSDVRNAEARLGAAHRSAHLLMGLKVDEKYHVQVKGVLGLQIAWAVKENLKNTTTWIGDIALGQKEIQHYFPENGVACLYYVQVSA